MTSLDQSKHEQAKKKTGRRTSQGKTILGGLLNVPHKRYEFKISKRTRNLQQEEQRR
jgi:hypothetical protein